jgi:hypothetical protein
MKWKVIGSVGGLETGFEPKMHPRRRRNPQRVTHQIREASHSVSSRLSNSADRHQGENGQDTCDAQHLGLHVGLNFLDPRPHLQSHSQLELSSIAGAKVVEDKDLH